MVDQLLAGALRVPVDEREQPYFRGLIALAEDAIEHLDVARAAEYATSLREIDVRYVEIAAAPGEMIFDVEEFDVAPGQRVELVFDNLDMLPHNLVITAPGAAETVGRAADAMASEPDAFARGFIPDMPSVLYATSLIGGGRTEHLYFTAPEEEGEYPYICSFPAHWLTMKGVMVVRKQEDDREARP